MLNKFLNPLSTKKKAKQTQTKPNQTKQTPKNTPPPQKTQVIYAVLVLVFNTIKK